MESAYARAWRAGTDPGDPLDPEQIVPTSPPHDTKHVTKTKEQPKDLTPRPSSGRTTLLGRRVEKPGHLKQGGPSGQTDSCKGDSQHTNK
jgi:hypothetical protein